jgi:predicted transposase/invertase (TIGR01784 family)
LIPSAFKQIFGSEKNKAILIHFLNDILGFAGENAIQDVEFLSTIMNPEIASDKQSIVDVLYKDSYGNKYIVEMVRPESLRCTAPEYDGSINKSGNFVH